MPNGSGRGPQTNVRLSQMGRTLLELLSETLGLTHKDVIELALRGLAREQGLWSPRSFGERGRKKDNGGAVNLG